VCDSLDSCQLYPFCFFWLAIAPQLFGDLDSSDESASTTTISVSVSTSVSSFVCGSNSDSGSNSSSKATRVKGQAARVLSLLGECYYWGWGTEMDKKKAIRLFAAIDDPDEPCSLVSNTITCQECQYICVYMFFAHLQIFYYVHIDVCRKLRPKIRRFRSWSQTPAASSQSE
jgi:hypothetical protein